MCFKEKEFFEKHKEITLYKLAACKVAKVITDIKYINNPVNYKQSKKNTLRKEITKLYLPKNVEEFIIETIKSFALCDITKYRIAHYNNILVKELYKWAFLKDNIKFREKKVRAFGRRTTLLSNNIIKHINKYNKKKNKKNKKVST